MDVLHVRAANNFAALRDLARNLREGNIARIPIEGQIALNVVGGKVVMTM